MNYKDSPAEDFPQRDKREPYYEQHSKVLVSVDCIIFGFDEGKLRVLIGRRRLNPGCGQWSLYGGFVNDNESINDAANRVLFELTGLKNLYMRQVGAFGNVDRDPGERVISIVYYALINTKDYDENLQKQHNVVWVNIGELPQMYSDHNEMVAKAHRMMFTLTQLQKLYEAVCGEEVDKRNFRKRIKDMDFIEKTELIDKTSSKRGAYLYRFNKKTYKEEPNFKL